MTNFGIFIIAAFAVLAIANGYLWQTQNKITTEELEQHLDEYLDKVEDGENVTIEYEGQLYAIVKVVKN